MRNWIPALVAIGVAASASADSDSSNDDASGEQTRGPLIVIDAGHGGANVGAPTTDRLVREKQFTLAVSERLERELRSRGARVVMTRRGDEYLTLRQRSAIANDNNADLFISIHGNASPDHSRRGFETYLLSASALDVDGRALRTKGPDRPGQSSAISRVLNDVERGVSHPKSAALAAKVQARLAKARPDSPNRGVKQESMHVLLGANMPAVLVELGFIDHTVEGAELLDPSVQDTLAVALADALLAAD